MVKIQGTTITMTRGDTLIVNVEIDNYTPQADDVIRFACARSYVSSEVAIRKTIPNDTLTLRLDPADTKDLAYGDYVYDIELTYADGRVDTFIAGATLRLTEEVE